MSEFYGKMKMIYVIFKIFYEAQLCFSARYMLCCFKIIIRSIDGWKFNRKLSTESTAVGSVHCQYYMGVEHTVASFIAFGDGRFSRLLKAD